MTAVEERVAELVAALAPDTVPVDPDEGDAADLLAEWATLSLDDASWCLRKLRLRRQQRAERVALAEAERARIAEFERKQTEKLDRDIAFFEDRLRVFHQGVLADDPKAKTVALPAGELRSVAGRVSVVVTDKDAFVQWAEENERLDVVAYKEPDIDKVAAAEAFGKGKKVGDEAGEYPASTDEGEVVPGIQFVRAERSYKVVVDSDE